jgi:hypothetical protein
MVSYTEKKNNEKTIVNIDGFYIYRNNMLSICAKCTKIKCICNHHPNTLRLCTNAGYWYDIKKKYNRKIMGNYRLVLWVRRQDIRK